MGRPKCRFSKSIPFHFCCSINHDLLLKKSEFGRQLAKIQNISVASWVVSHWCPFLFSSFAFPQQSTVKFHFIGLKCANCGGYNTTKNIKTRSFSFSSTKGKADVDILNRYQALLPFSYCLFVCLLRTDNPSTSAWSRSKCCRRCSQLQIHGYNINKKHTTKEQHFIRIRALQSENTIFSSSLSDFLNELLSHLLSNIVSGFSVPWCYVSDFSAVKLASC